MKIVEFGGRCLMMMKRRGFDDGGKEWRVMAGVW